jgi:hypothetical protein
LFGWIDSFYEEAEPAMEPGHIWCDQPIYLPPRHGLKVERVSPNDDSVLDLTVCGRTAEIFEHPPIHSLRMDSGEGVVVTKTKRDRPVIILGGANANEIRPRSTDHANIVMAIPVYGADQYDQQVRTRMARYDFANVFYLPSNARPAFDEGFGRLDHVQPVVQTHLRQHRGLKLTSDALNTLVEWFITFTTGREEKDSIILEYRREMNRLG